MSKNLQFLQKMLKPWQALTPPFSRRRLNHILTPPFLRGVKPILTPFFLRGVGGIIVVGVLLLGLETGESKYTSFLLAQPAYAQQRVSPAEAWQRVYQQLPDLPRENRYISQETGKVAENNTLVNRMIRYHIYVKGRAPNYRLDWKLTLADYLDANEVMYETSYPGNDTLRQNPFQGDRAVIGRLNRRQRDALVQALVNAFNPR